MKLKRFIPYILPYKRQAFLNIFFNILYSLFSALSFVALIPMLDVLFGKAQPITEAPVYSGNLLEFGSYGKAYLNYKVGALAGEESCRRKYDLGIGDSNRLGNFTFLTQEYV